MGLSTRGGFHKPRFATRRSRGKPALEELKQQLSQKTTQARGQRERAERRQKKEEEAAQRKAEQLALFTF